MRKKRIAAAYRYSFSRLVLQLYLYWESHETAYRETVYEEEFCRILGEFLDGKGSLEELNRLREQIIGRTEILTGYSDCYQIYEYVLNRVERRFVIRKDSDYTSEDMAQHLVQCVARLEQQADRNERLRQIVAQLPVRFTRQKFYSMVMERLFVYTGVDRGSMEDFLYMLKSSAMVCLPEHMEQEKELYGFLQLFRDTDYRRLEKAAFHRCEDALGDGGRLLVEKTDFYVSLQEMINELYVLFLTEPEAIIDAVEDQWFRTGAKRILDGLQKDGGAMTEEESSEILSRMEGIQESVMELVQAASPEKDEILNKVDRLVSGSAFMPVEKKEKSSQEADRPWLEEQADELCRQLGELFTQVPKAVERAVMAKVLSSLPVIFRTGEEVENYIRSSLESCSDYAEREACMELLEQELME